MLDHEHWQLGLGAGLGLMYSYTALETQDGSVGAFVDDEVIYPFGMASLGYFFTDRIGLLARGEGVVIGDNWVYNFGGEVVWRAAQAWDFVLGYSYFGRQIESDTYYNKTRYGIPHLAVSRYW